MHASTPRSLRAHLRQASGRPAAARWPLIGGLLLLLLPACAPRPAAPLEYEVGADLEWTSARFDVRGTEAWMRGEIDSATPARIRSLLHDHPEVDTLVLADVPGSVDDHANVRAARLVRAAGLTTRVPPGGEVASGGVDLFLAGRARRAAPDARLGVHSWSDGRIDGADVPPDDPQHALYLELYEELGIPTAFYWFTLTAAPADDIHWMTPAELERFGVLTD